METFTFFKSLFNNAIKYFKTYFDVNVLIKKFQK